MREPVDGVKLEIMIVYRVAFEKPQNILQYFIFIKTKIKGNKFCCQKKKGNIKQTKTKKALTW